MTMNRTITIVAAALLLAAGLQAAEEQPSQDAEETVQDRKAVAEAVAPSLVKVEYWLRFDKGEPPRGDTRGSLDVLIEQERPLEQGGYLLSPTRVITSDVGIHPRFIKDIQVRFGDQVVKAQPAGLLRDQDAAMLELASPLKDAKGLVFDAKLPPPYRSVMYGKSEAAWVASVRGMPSVVTLMEKGEGYSASPAPSVVTDSKGKPVGMAFSQRLPLDESWKGSPLDKPATDAKEMERLLGDFERRCDRCLLRVSLSFRSPKKSAGERFPWRARRQDRDEEETERNTLGVLVDDRTVLVPENLPARVTGRLERVEVHAPDGPVSASFAGTLLDYGGFLVTLEKPLAGPAVLSADDVSDYGGKLLLAASVIVQGEKRVAYFKHSRLSDFVHGWRRQVYPSTLGDNDCFLFTLDGKLLAMPIARRVKIAAARQWEAERAMLTASSYLEGVLAERANNLDAGNVPLPEGQENRLAWMGLELQGLNRELARTNNVSDLTNDGAMGALVAYVYPDSPAAKAGIEPGFVLLRLHVEGQPRPLEVKMEEYPFAGGQFPWDELDQVPEQYLDQIPAPWPPAENSFIRTLTDMGFGKKYQAEFYGGGKIVTKDFEVVESPPHFEAAPRYKSKELGLTVRDLTYEVRRFLQRGPADPGVIVSKVEPGSKAAVAKIMPYEVITHVNDQPVAGVKDFEKLTAEAGELRFSVKRMTRGRVVKIKLTASTQPSASRPSATSPGSRAATSQPASRPLAQPANRVRVPARE